MSIIGFLAKISTFKGIFVQIMLVFDGFWKLRYENIPSKTYYISQQNNYLAPFIIYLSKSVNRKFLLETITSSSPSSYHPPPIVEYIYMTALKFLFIEAVIIIGSIEKRFKWMSNRTYHWIQDDGPRRFTRLHKLRHYRGIRFKYFMLVSYGEQ